MIAVHLGQQNKHRVKYNLLLLDIYWLFATLSDPGKPICVAFFCNDLIIFDILLSNMKLQA